MTRPPRRLLVSWLAGLVVVTATLVVAATGDQGPRSNQERVYDIAASVKCPQCAGQSVAESDVAISREIRAEIARLVEEGLSDDGIRADISAGYAVDIRLEPASDGLVGLVWVIPVLGGVAVVGGLVVAFRRWSVAAGVEAGEPERPARPLRWAAGLVLVAVAVVLVLRSSADRRDPGDLGTGDVSSSSRSLRAEADACLASGDVGCALDALDALLEIDPADTEAMLRQADLYVLENRTADAYDAYDAVLALEPANVEALTYRARLVLVDGDPDAALEAWAGAIAVDPTYLDAWTFRILALSEAGRLDEAVLEVGALVESGDADIAVAVGDRLFAQGALLEAVQVYDSVIAVEENALALAYRGWLVAQADLNEEALTYLDRAVAADPSLPDALVFRAVVLSRLGRLDEARAALAAFDALGPPPAMAAMPELQALRDALS